MTLHQRRTHPVPVEGCFGCKASTIQFGQIDATEQKQWDRELDLYADARRQGVQPATTKTKDIRAAMEVSEQTGQAFDATNPYKHVNLEGLADG